MHAIEKMICANAKRKSLTKGSFVDVEVDFTILNDLYQTSFDSFSKLRPELKLFNPDKFGLCYNYFSAPPSERSIAKKLTMDKLVAANRRMRQFDIYRGTWQEEFINNRLAWCGDVVLSADPHTPSLGGLGILALSGGESDMAASMATGRTWLIVPDIIEIRLNGDAKPGIAPFDIAMRVMKEIDRSDIAFKAVEFTGSYVEKLDPSSRMTLCDLFSELEPQTCYISPSEAVLTFLERKNGKRCEKIESDPGYSYSKSFEFDVSEVNPMISLSADCGDIHEVSELAEQDIKVTEGFIGGCQSGQTKDIAPAYNLLNGKKLPDKSVLTICPASNTVLRECMNLGYISAFEKAGAKCISVGCASCIGMREDTMSFGNPILSNTNRIFCGRMKLEKVKLYQASSLTIVKSIMNGFITDPLGE